MSIEVKYSLDDSDYLAYNLYAASTSERIKKKRKKEWLILSFSFALLGLSLYYVDSHFMGICFFMSSVIIFIFYPLYQRRAYVKHYHKHVKETHKDSFYKEAYLTIGRDGIHVVDDGVKSDIKLSQITSIVETGHHVFIKLLSGYAIVVPTAKTERINDLIDVLKDIARELSVNYSIEHDWKWR